MFAYLDLCYLFQKQGKENLKAEVVCLNLFTVKPVLSSHSKIDNTKVLKTNGSLMQAESIAECTYLPVSRMKQVKQ